MVAIPYLHLAVVEWGYACACTRNTHTHTHTHTDSLTHTRIHTCLQASCKPGPGEYESLVTLGPLAPGWSGITMGQRQVGQSVCLCLCLCPGMCLRLRLRLHLCVC